jgi:hypothetical protein
VHRPEIREAARALVKQGVNDCEIARRLGVPRGTVRDWRRPRYVPRFGRCPRCWRRARRTVFSDDDYAELLGLYLGDGHISAAAGRKHDRRIVLEGWQRRIVDAAPWAFLRGCIRSDGCVFINRTGRYEYLSYGFANHSSDILDLFEWCCLAQGLRPRRYAQSIRLNRREDVGRMLEHVGVKS